MSAKSSRATVHHGSGTGGRPPPVPARRAYRGAAGGPAGAHGQMGPPPPDPIGRGGGKVGYHQPPGWRGFWVWRATGPPTGRRRGRSEGGGGGGRTGPVGGCAGCTRARRGATR